MLYWLVKFVLLGPLVRVTCRPEVHGLENIPTRGGAVLASNHLSAADWIFLPLMVRRRVIFLAKAEYFRGSGVKGWLQRLFFSGTGQVPIDRTSASAAENALSTGTRILSAGSLLGIYPEGTRSPDARLYRGKTGVARMALESGVPVIPVAMVHTEKVQPLGKRLPRIHKVEVRIGKPLDFSRYAGLSGDRFVERSITDEIMYEIMTLSGQEYVDLYGAKVKAAMDATGNTAVEAVAQMRPPARESADRVPTTLAG
ncbi:1-acyl-sn-glycerol-3-phosphate acyltransferase [Modestobacter sp. I12A-02628]|uniref:1-acyl-sn-glycerol-3-phosphate acyltransferase n=1 Tax=Goekera deserti TaxID=2497753 RepID=A0A7K3WAJ1_9ACTN|nr:1-acyl-sn-glycerol-3-phosphate acyltransferase [Goekera deserti]NDI47661.1 1-acyl-sn-glycerol-3-phosphate acyltransferase [Goekera deserti]NDI47724.1 1-acyl-sn-glycerol-3-phosphate acyltransferase [Goekera deserti]NEL53472.1 1-acyl-sn-glycerol-3-phosphate acyltransferase [Goekera deserti]